MGVRVPPPLPDIVKGPAQAGEVERNDGFAGGKSEKRGFAKRNQRWSEQDRRTSLRHDYGHARISARRPAGDEAGHLAEP